MKSRCPLFLVLYSLISLSAPFTDPSSNPTSMFYYLKKFLPEAPIILEAGANLGEDTKIMKSVWPNATMHVFEPVPWSFIKLTDNTQHLRNVTCYECALSTYCGKTSFHIDIPNNGASSILPPVDFNRSEFDPQPITVDCITLNAWAQEHHVKNIDFMWLDMEGHELYALENASDILDTVKVIYTEVDYVPVRQGSCLYSDLRTFLELQDFTEIWKDSSHWRFGNALFVKNSLLDTKK